MSQTTLRFEFLPSYREEDFLVSDANKEAYRWMTQPLEAWPANAFNLYGPPASGKTHLAHLWKLRHHAGWLPLERLKDTSPPVLLEGHQTWVAEGPVIADYEKAWFHLLNTLQQEKKHLLITSRPPLSRGKLTLPDLASRLLALPTAALREPDDALLEAVFYKRFSDMQLKVSPEVVRYLLGRMERSFVSLDTIIKKLDALSLVEKKNITLPLARKILETQ